MGEPKTTNDAFPFFLSFLFKISLLSPSPPLPYSYFTSKYIALTTASQFLYFLASPSTSQRSILREIREKSGRDKQIDR